MATPYKLTAHAARQIERRKIDFAWLQTALDDPDEERSDAEDPTIRHRLKRIEEMDGRVLRVLYNQEADPIRIVSAFFDRRLRDRR
jgi:hypothetical protein